MKNKIIRVLSIAFLFVSCAAGVFAWGGKTHMKMVSDAYHIMPEQFRQFLGEETEPELKKPALRLLIRAAVEPDRELKDFRNHIFHIQSGAMGHGPFHIEKLVDEVADLIANDGDKQEIIQKLGWISHYATDLTQPLHTGSSLDDTIEEKSFHSATERHADRFVMTYGVNFDGCTNIHRVPARMIYEALWANQFYQALQNAYTIGNKYEDAKEVIAKCYSRAVNNVVDLWYTAWIKSGAEEGPTDKLPKNFPPAEAAD